MARARNIKPGFFKNEVLVEQSMFVRLLFVGLWTLADREGRIEDRPKRIKLELFPCDSEDVDAGLTVLHNTDFIKRYTVAGKSVIQICNFLKHQTPHGSEKDSELPDETGELTIHERTPNGYVTGQKRTKPDNEAKNNVILPNNNGATQETTGSEQDSSVDLRGKTTLNPESLILNPESLNLNPDTGILNPDGCAGAPPSSVQAPPAPPPQTDTETAFQALCREIWKSYSLAYFNRYGTQPVRNAKSNSQVKELAKRLGREAVDISAWYVGHPKGYYTQKAHTLDALVSDAESLRTQWATNNRVTTTRARQIDQTATNASAADEAKRLLRERGSQQGGAQ